MRAWLLLLSLSFSCWAFASEPKVFTFDGTEYFHRWSKDDQHDFTPLEQIELSDWSDMVSLYRYPGLQTAAELEALTNVVLAHYSRNGGIILKSGSTAGEPGKPLEYYLTAQLPQHDYQDAVFARFRLVNGVSTGAIYVHRIYGENTDGLMALWLKQHGAAKRKALKSWQANPTLHIGR